MWLTNSTTMKYARSIGPARASRFWLLHLLLGALAGAAVFLLGLQTPARQVVAIGSYGDWHTLQGWHSPEPGPWATTLRWSGERSSLMFQPQGTGTGLLELQLINPHPTMSATVALKQEHSALLAFEAAPQQLRRYQLLVPLPDDGGGLVLGIQSSLYEPAGDSRVLGVGLTGVSLKGPLQRQLYLCYLGPAALGALLIGLLITLIWASPWIAPLIALLLPAMFSVLAHFERPLALQAATILPWLALGLLGYALILRRFAGAVRARPILLVSLALAVALALRFWNLEWDNGGLFHPDEWIFNEVSRTLKPPWHPHFFAYGGFLIYLYRITAEVLSSIGDPDWLSSRSRFVLIGRTYSAMASSLTLVVMALLAWRWKGASAAVWSALLLAGLVLAVQHAHYGTTDSALTLQAALLAYASLRYLQRGSRRTILAAGIILGVSIATKIPAASFGIFPATALVLRAWSSRQEETRPLRRMLGHAGLLAASAIPIAILCSPYYLLDWRGLLRAMSIERAAASGMADFTYQFIDSMPYLYQLRNGLLTMGPPVVLLGLAGWLWLLARSLRHRQPADLLVLSWPTIYFLLIGGVFIKFNRYMLPLAPFFCLFAGVLLSDLSERFSGRHLVVGLGAAAVALTLGYGLVYAIGVYGQPDPRMAASFWIYRHVAPGSMVLREEHEMGPLIPFQEPDNPLALLYGPFLYTVTTLQVYNPETSESPSYYAQTLSSADYLIVSSRSQHVTFRRFPERFPVRACLYEQLFAGELGYTMVKSFTRGPQIGSWRIDGEHNPQIEETFQVFDHPTVLIFARTQPVTAERIESALMTGCWSSTRSGMRENLVIR